MTWRLKPSLTSTDPISRRTATAIPFISPKARGMSAMSRTVIQTSGSARRGSGKALSGPVLQRLVPPPLDRRTDAHGRSEEHTSELQSLMRISYDVFCLKKKKKHNKSPQLH